MPKISITSPSNRSNGLTIVHKCLSRQTFTDFEFLVCRPSIVKEMGFPDEQVYGDPPKKRGDYYSLNKSWNFLFRQAKGELIVSIVDYTEFSDDTLERLWNHYIERPNMAVSGVGYQYDKGKLVWKDPRLRLKGKGLIPLHPADMEFRLASIPRRAIQAVGGMDEIYDEVVGNSEKEICLRISYLGYRFGLDKDLKYKFYKHEEHGKEWDSLYKKSLEMLGKHSQEIAKGERSSLNFIKRD